GAGGGDARGTERIVFKQVIDGDAPFMHLVRVDRGDGVGVQRDSHQAVGIGGPRLAFHRNAQRLSLIETDRPWPSRPSTSARVMVVSLSAAGFAGSQSSVVLRFLKWCRFRPVVYRAVLVVGRT